MRFADAVLRNEGPLPDTPDVRRATYWPPNAIASTVHAGVVWTFARLRQLGVDRPCVAVPCRSNTLVADISTYLSEPHTYNNQNLAPVDHDVAWDAEPSAAAAIVVSTILEWPRQPAAVSVAQTLRAIAGYYQIKNAEKPSNAAAQNARRFGEAFARVAAGQTPRIRAAQSLLAAHRTGIFVDGDPVADWKAARSLLERIDALAELYREVRLVRLFHATDALAAALSDRWLTTGSYAGASNQVRRILEQEKLISAERDPRGCILMNMHKAKGKEFDGVVLVEGSFKLTFFNAGEPPPHERSRRLLRVALTRARTLVTIIRTRGAPRLVD